MTGLFADLDGHLTILEILPREEQPS